MQRRTNWLQGLPMLVCLLALASIALAQAGNGAAQGGPQEPGFFQDLGTRLDAWQAWLHALPVPLYVAAFLSFIVSWVPGFLIFLLCFSAGVFAPTAARVGLWVFALLWFIVLLGLFMPPAAPGWWWLLAVVVVVCLLLMVPRPRTQTTA